LSDPVGPEDLVSQIVKRDVSKAGRSSTILYLVNAVIVILGSGILSAIFAPYFSIGFLEHLLWLLVTGTAVYAIIVYIRTRSRQSKNLGVHFYILGVLGLCTGTLFASWGEIAVYGTDKLVNLKTSRLVRIGYSIPRKWRNAGIGWLLGGVVLYALAYFFAQLLLYSIDQILLIDGIVLVSTWYISEKMYFGGRIRLPEDFK
jgi:hypothetical protein